VALAAVNRADRIVLSGAAPALAAAAKDLEAAGVRARALEVQAAYHSPIVDPILDPLEAAIRATAAAARPPGVRFVSSVLGAPAAAEVATPAYWRRQLRDPVRFADALAALEAEGAGAWIELGPSPVLLALAGPAPSGRVHAASLKRGKDDGEMVAHAIGAL